MGAGTQYMIGSREQVSAIEGESPNERVFLVEGSFNEEELQARALGRWNPLWKIYQLTEVPHSVVVKDVTVKGNVLTLK